MISAVIHLFVLPLEVIFLGAFLASFALYFPYKENKNALPLGEYIITVGFYFVLFILMDSLLQRL